MTPASSDVLQAGVFSVVYDQADTDLAHRSAAILEEALAEFAPHLPAQEQPMLVVIAHTIDEFARYAGGYSRHQVQGIARAEQSIIVVKAPALTLSGHEYKNTLRHELVHILLERNTNTAVLPRWLNEGIAMHLAGEYPWASFFRVGKMYLYNQLIDYPHLDFAFMIPGNDHAFSDAYAQSLSMTRYLHGTLGEEKLWAVVKGCNESSFLESLQQNGGMTINEFWAGYMRSLWWVALVGSLSAGTFFLPMPFILMLAWWRRRRRDQAILARWEKEEALEPWCEPEPEYYDEAWEEDQSL
jgi:hypothetical protein